MSLHVFGTICVLGVDFLIYVLFRWTYADKRRAWAKKLAEQRKAMRAESSRPLVERSPKNGAVTQARLQRVRESMAGVALEKRRILKGKLNGGGPRGGYSDVSATP